MSIGICDKKQKNPRRGRRSADPEGAAERAAEAFRLSTCGHTLRAIATELGVSPTAAHAYLEAGRQQQIDSIRHDAKERQADRHGAIQAIICEAWANYRATSNLAALELARKCEADLRKLYGDDAAEKSQVKVEGSGVAFLPKEQMYASVMASIARLEGKGA